MGSNEEIRKRMETYRSILLVLNWIISIALIIAGFVMMDLLGGVAFVIIIVAIILGIIGHFLTNVALAIPFILLNNGDNLIAMAQINGSGQGSLGIEFKPTHKINLLTGADGLSLRKISNPNADPFTKIANGTEVQHLRTGDEIKLNDIKGYWYEIITKDKIKGWCFSGSLEKI